MAATGYSASMVLAGKNIAAMFAALAYGLVCSAADELPFTIQSWQVQHGLPENQVTCLAQTPDGYLWVGTQDGLARFDGVRFVNFGRRDGLRSTWITSLLADHEGTLWVGTSEGLHRWRDGQFRTYDLNAGLPSLVINQLAEDSDGRFWVGTGSGLALRQGDRFIRPDLPGLPARLRSRGVNALRFGRDGRLWLSFFNDTLWQVQNGECSRATDATAPAALRDACHSIWEDRAGRLWVGAGDNELLCRNGTNWQEFAVPPTPGLENLSSLAEGADGTIWTGSMNNGLYFVQSNRLEHITAAEGLSEDAIRALLVDREGNLWVGTAGGGLNRVARKSVHAFGRNEGLTRTKVRGVAEVAPGELWVGTMGDGLFRWQAGAFTRLEADAEFRNYAYVNALLVARDGSCWVGTGIALHHFVNGRRELHPEWSSKFGGGSGLALCEDRQEGVWVGVDNQLWRVRQGKLERQTNCVVGGSIASIVQERDGALWLGTARGLRRFQAGNTRSFGRADGLGSDQVLALHLDAQGALWIGTTDGGLSRLHEGRFATVTSRQGLPDDTISQILEDATGTLWLGCNRGIVRVAKNQFDEVITGRAERLFPRVLGLADGMLSEECTGGYSPAGLKLKSGELCFSTLKGIVIFDPKQISQESPPPPVLLEELLVDGIPQGPGGTRGHGAAEIPGNTLVVPPGDHRLEFHYTGLNFTAPERVQFRYQLEGLDHSRVEAENERVATYNHVPPGSYRFRVLACNQNGIWSPNPAMIQVQVRPFLWQRVWFTPALSVLGTALVGLSLGMAERRRQQRKREKLEALHAIERERARIAKDIHDDLGSTLAQIRLLSNFAQSPEGSVERVRQDVRQIAAKALDSTQALDEIVWAVDPQADTLESFVSYASAFASEHLALANVACRLDLPEAIPAIGLRADVRHNLFLALKEALTNVVKYAAATEARLKMRATDDTLSVTLSDNGRGFDAGENPTEPAPTAARGRHGLANMQARMAAIGGHCDLQSAPGQGTSVSFRIRL
jgi:ligand-binding sensor domain-containing protein/signal transduction histidine kinase